MAPPLKNIHRIFYESVNEVTISNVEVGAEPRGEAEIKFTYTLKNEPNKIVVEFIPKDKDFYYVMKDGQYSNLVVAKSLFDKPDGLRESYYQLMDSLE